MTATIISLLAVTISFTGLVVWVFWPSHKENLESHGGIVFDDESDSEGNKS